MEITIESMSGSPRSAKLSGRSRGVWALAALGAVLLLATAIRPKIASVPPKIEHYYSRQGALTNLLVDEAHAPPSEFPGGLTRTNYRYYDISNWNRLLLHLGQLGVSTDIMREGQLTPELLSRYKLLCLYFPTQTRPYQPGELDAVEAWVRSGGGLMVVGEHTNAEGCADQLEPLLSRFGMSLTKGSIVDPDNTFAFAGWDKQWRFSNHPVAQGLRAIALISTASVTCKPDHPDQPVAISLSSPTSFLDAWDPARKDRGFSGDFVKNASEPSGPLAAVAAATPGKGRVIVTADHNAFSNVFLYYADNLALAVQAWRWLSKDAFPMPASPYPYDGRDLDLTIFMPETTRPSNVMTPQSFEKGPATQGYFTFYTALSRHPGVHTRCSEWLQGRYPVILVCPSEQRLAKPYLKYLVDSYKEGSTIILMLDPRHGLSPPTRQLLDAFGIELPSAPVALPSQPLQVIVGGQSLGSIGAQAYAWKGLKGRALMELQGASTTTPMVVEAADRVQLFVQAQLVRNDAFHTPGGQVLGTGPIKPGPEGMVIFQALWRWLDLLTASIQGATKSALPAR